MFDNKNNSLLRKRIKVLFMTFVIFLCVCFLNCNFLFAQDSVKIDSHQQQVRLLEDLLETYMKRDDAAWKTQGEALSLEINQWGIIFFIQVGFKYQDNILFNLPNLDKNDNVPKPAVNIDSIKIELRTILTEFIREYTHILSWLKPDERIMIVVHQNPPSGVGTMLGIPFGDERKPISKSTDKKKAAVNFSLTVTNKIVDDYRKQRIRKEGFNTQILYKELNETDQKEYSEFYKAIETLGTGFRSAVQQASKRALNDHDILSFYIPGYGVIYTINILYDFLSFNFLGLDSSVLAFTQKTLKNALSGIKIDSLVDSALGKNGLEGLNNKLKKLNEKLEVVIHPKRPPIPPPGINVRLPGIDISIKPETYNIIKENLLKTLANFGHTLNLFKDTENITILLLSKNIFFSTHSQGKWILSATMDDILKYHRQELTFEQFKDRVKIQTY